MGVNNLLEVRGLHVVYGARRGEPVPAVCNVSFTLREGDSLGLIGESGCGKTSIIRALLRLHSAGTTVSGQALFKGRDLLSMPEGELRSLRWKELSLVPQSAMNALNPVQSIGAQIVEGLLTHQSMGSRQAWDQAREALELVGIPGERVRAYPHQLSGGMKQRVCLAMAMSLRPSLVVADEPTTGLDVILQDRILAEIERLQRQFGIALLLVSHDIGVVTETCRNVVVLYGGQVAESGPVEAVFAAPTHPYTMGLVNASVTLSNTQRAISIPGTVPELKGEREHCVFNDRCPFATDLCRARHPPLLEVGEGHLVACHHTEHAAEFRLRAVLEETWQRGA